jgi:hypothetical protein
MDDRRIGACRCFFLRRRTLFLKSCAGPEIRSTQDGRPVANLRVATAALFVPKAFHMNRWQGWAALW